MALRTLQDLPTQTAGQTGKLAEFLWGLLRVRRRKGKGKIPELWGGKKKKKREREKLSLWTSFETIEQEFLNMLLKAFLNIT